MKVHYDINALPAFRNSIITIGTFDGVHEGHRQVIHKLTGLAKEVNGESVIITFHPHPRKIVSSAILGIRLLNTLEEKISLVNALEVDHLVVVPFTEMFANQPAEEYIRNFIVEKFNPHTIIIGYDHRFGRDRLGDYRLLEYKAQEFGYRLLEIPKHLLENISISSTNIREAILHNDIVTANKLLGYHFFFSGTVVHGDKLGRELGYPTANLKINDEEKIIPGNGIYAVYAETIEPLVRYRGMMSIGFRPTVNGNSRVIEVNIFDFNEDIYDKQLRVHVVQYLREEIRFDGLPALVRQIDQDKIDTLRIFDAIANI